MPITNHLPPLNLYSKKKKKSITKGIWPIGKKDRKVFITQVEARFRKLTKTYFFLGLGGKEGEKFFEKEEAKNI